MNSGRILIGVVLVILGGVWLLDAAGAGDAGMWIREGWPAVFVFLGAAQTVIERRVSVVSGVLVVAGAVALAVTTGAVDADLWALVWPVLLIGAGVWLVVRRRFPPVCRDAEISRLVVLAPGRIVSRAEGLRRADVTALFSALRLDLTGASLAGGRAKVAATAVFGSVVIVVPKGWQIEVRGIPVFGGWDDTTSRVDAADDAPCLRVQVLSLFGGVEVRHPRVWR